MSRFLTANDLATIKDYLSEPRLGTFRALTRSGREEDAIELHQATMSLGVALTAVTGLIEVGLRNAACREITASFRCSDWLRHAPTGLNWAALEIHAIKKAESHARRAVYSKLSNADKTALDALAFPNGQKPSGLKHRKLAEKRQAVIAVSDGQVVAQLTMHFWKRLFSEQYEKTLWKRALRKTFPLKSITRAEVAAHLEVIYEIRNRLAHHEPVYGSRLHAVLTAIDFVCTRFDNRTPNEVSAFAKLIQPQRDILSGQVAILRATFDRLTA